MAKEITGYVKLQVKGGAANPSPPIGPALGSKGLNIMEFCKQFNDRTKDRPGVVLPVVISVFKDKSFTFILKSPPVAVALKKAAGLAKASPEPGRNIIGKITEADVVEIAKTKMSDFNTTKLESAIRLVKGTARSMGLEVVEKK